jgi:hypothetical protein
MRCGPKPRSFGHETTAIQDTTDWNGELFRGSGVIQSPAVLGERTAGAPFPFCLFLLLCPPESSKIISTISSFDFSQR